jgi:hypothetical protein
VHVRISILVVLLSLAEPLFAGPCTAYPPGPWPRDKASAERFEQEWLTALKQKNIAALDCMLAYEFKDTAMKGALRPKSQVLRELPLRSDQYQQNLADVNAELFGDTAVVRGVDVVTDQQGHEVFRIRFTDVLCYKHKHWLAVAAQETVEAQPH